VQKLNVELIFSTSNSDRKTHAAQFDVENDFDIDGSPSLYQQMFRECHVGLLYNSYRARLPEFRSFTEEMEWFAPQAGTSDLIRWAAHMNTAQVWWQIQNTFTEAAHLLSRAEACDEIEAVENDEDGRLFLHLTKIQYFDSAAHLICKIEDWFLLLLFVNSGCSLVPAVDVHSSNWRKQISRREIGVGLRLRKSEGHHRSNPYLDSLSDEHYRTIRRVFRKLGQPLSVRTVRKYRNEIAHRGLPAVDVPVFSPSFRFPRKVGRGISLGIPAGAKIEYKFVELYQHASDALKHLEAQLLQIRRIPVLAPT
jgi:hypothetical protein